jgi:branched-chain amino acid aminotransferase
LEIQKTSKPKIKPRPEDNLIFGKLKTDHILEVDWEEGKGWDTPKIVPYHNFLLDPWYIYFL